MAEVIVKQGMLSVEGILYRKGDVVDVDNAEELVRRSAGRIVMAGAASKPSRQEKAARQEKPQSEAVQVVEEEAVSLPDADPAAAVRK